MTTFFIKITHFQYYFFVDEHKKEPKRREQIKHLHDTPSKEKAQIDKEQQQRRKEHDKTNKEHDKNNKEQDHTDKVKDKTNKGKGKAS